MKTFDSPGTLEITDENGDPYPIGKLEKGWTLLTKEEIAEYERTK